MRMRREAHHNGLAQLAKVVREAGHFGAVHPGVDEQHAIPAVHDNGVALHELALVDQHTVRDLPQQGAPSACDLQPLVGTVVPHRRSEGAYRSVNVGNAIQPKSVQKVLLGHVPGSLSGNQLPQQVPDTAVDLLDDRSHGLRREPGRVRKRPVDIPLARVDGTGIPTPHGHDHVSASTIGLGEWLWKVPRGVETPLLKDFHHRRIEMGSRVGTRRSNVDPTLGVVVKKHPSGEAATRVVGAKEEDDGTIGHGRSGSTFGITTAEASCAMSG